ncbi:MAG: 50S ribosomal protein L9 [Fusobacteriaceae bacterium]
MSKLEIILTEDVAGQGRKGEIVSVSEGYARNFILKANKGIIATPEELKKIETRKKKEAEKAAEEKIKAQELKKVLESKSIKISVKAGENGKLYGAITNKELAEDIKKDFGLDIDKKKIECNIHSLGEHTAIIKLHSEVKAEVKIITESK